jgi:glycolate oxidase FAD binding subunit|tara:strand:- start:446 stop:1336 length:891 start_codon:yes stop_codon:yes gene_type:complete
MTPVDYRMEAFRGTVGISGPVCVRGGGTRWGLGGGAAGAREVSAPLGILALEPAEMTVKVGAGTLLADLADALADHGQEVGIDGPLGSTVGGALAVGRGPLRRRRVGAVADVLLQADCVGADGATFTAGGPTVKNVTGYDLCRLLVGSLGTLALLGVVILRTRPLPARIVWMGGEVEPDRVLSETYRPACVLWDGARTSVLLEGHAEDLERTAGRLARLGMAGMDPPDLPVGRGRWTGHLPSGGVLEVGTGVVHQPLEGAPPTVDDGVRALGDRMKASFDPTGRLNPGRDPYGAVA